MAPQPPSGGGPGWTMSLLAMSSPSSEPLGHAYHISPLLWGLEGGDPWTEQEKAPGAASSKPVQALKQAKIEEAQLSPATV